jgi:hypothetical protein
MAATALTKFAPPGLAASLIGPAALMTVAPAAHASEKSDAQIQPTP